METRLTRTRHETATGVTDGDIRHTAVTPDRLQQVVNDIPPTYPAGIELQTIRPWSSTCAENFWPRQIGHRITTSSSIKDID